MIKIIYITTEKFTASVRLSESLGGTRRVYYASPSVHFMHGWVEKDVLNYIRIMDWDYTEEAGFSRKLHEA